jgi:uncharacterized protein YkwD
VGLTLLTKVDLKRTFNASSMKIKCILLGGALLFGAFDGLTANWSPPLNGNQIASALFTNYTSSSFRLLPAATNAVSSDRLNRELLDAAVFHETNRRREQNGLPPLAYNGKARQMARIQSRAMAKDRFVEHTNPDPQQRNDSDRARTVGLHPRFLGENVASTFGLRYQSGMGFFVREERGRKIYSLQPNGAPIPPHSYVSFAEALLDEWMQSTAHRQNILHKSPEFLGCACEPSSDDSAMETFYCTQVFFTPF